MVGWFGRAKSAGDNARIHELEAMIAALKGRQCFAEITLDGVIVQANENFLVAMGYSEAELVGRPHSQLLFPEMRDSAEDKDFWAQLRRGEPVSAKFRRAARDGREVCLYATYYCLRDPAGEPWKIVVFGADITEMEQVRIAAEQERAARAQAQERAFRSLGAALRALSEGDLTVRLDRNLPVEYRALGADLAAAMSRLAETLTTISANAEAMRSGADEITHAADDLSRRTEQQAATLEETAAALEEITATVKRTAEGAVQADQVVGGAKVEAEKSGEIVRQAVSAMGGIAKSAQQISQIIGVIDEIAFQTNLLALNAGVEAARAGDAGKGFAVVASEVRALAQRSAEAAKEIKSLISASSQQVQQGVSLVGQTGEALERIVGKVAEISALVSEISASAQEQATGLAQVNSAVNQMDQVTQQNAAMVEQSTAATHALLGEASELVRQVSRFRLEAEPAEAPRSAAA